MNKKISSNNIFPKESSQLQLQSESPFLINNNISINKDKVKNQMKDMIRKSESKGNNEYNPKNENPFTAAIKPKNTMEIHNEKISKLSELNDIAEKCYQKQTYTLKGLVDEISDTHKLIEYYKKQIELEKRTYEEMEGEEKKIKYREEILISQIKTEIEKNMLLIQNVREECHALEADLTEKEYHLAYTRQKSSEVQNRIEFISLELDDKIKLKNFKQNEIFNKEKIIEETQSRIINVNRINSNYIDHLRMIHNDLQETKGNIRVFCRVRPALHKEMQNESQSVNLNYSNNMNNSTYIEYANSNTIVLNGPVTKSNVGKKQETQSREIYKFDRVFKPEDTQEEIFKEISQLVQSALDGYKVCIFAYGQTGSGKTYTMEGEDKDRRGIIPRSIEQIFEFKNTLQNMGWSFTVEASCFEIYMDQVRDLLMNASNNIIPHNKSDKFTTIEVKQIEDMHSILETASKKRAVAETLCNEASSRSHCIFQLKITGKNNQTKQERHGALNLIDLAGSERVSNSKVEGERLKETISINKSLTCLKSVITALVNNNLKLNTHIPYRDSILTFLLQNYLGGDSKTLMFVNISPLSFNFSESSCSLKFASDVNSCYVRSMEDK